MYIDIYIYISSRDDDNTYICIDIGINKERSISGDRAYILDNVDIKSTEFGDCQYLTFVIVRPSGLIQSIKKIHGNWSND